MPFPLLQFLKEYKNNSIRDINNRIINVDKNIDVTAIINYKIKKSGVDASVHEFRHTYATKLIANGIDFKTVAKLLGHNVEQTMKTYSHVTDDMMKRAANIIENIF